MRAIIYIFRVSDRPAYNYSIISYTEKTPSRHDRLQKSREIDNHRRVKLCAAGATCSRQVKPIVLFTRFICVYRAYTYWSVHGRVTRENKLFLITAKRARQRQRRRAKIDANRSATRRSWTTRPVSVERFNCLFCRFYSKRSVAVPAKFSRARKREQPTTVAIWFQPLFSNYFKNNKRSTDGSLG